MISSVERSSRTEPCVEVDKAAPNRLVLASKSCVVEKDVLGDICCVEAARESVGEFDCVGAVEVLSVATEEDKDVEELDNDEVDGDEVMEYVVDAVMDEGGRFGEAAEVVIDLGAAGAETSKVSLIGLLWLLNT